MTAFEKSPAYVRGDKGERTVLEYLQDRGFLVSWLAHIRNIEGISAPMMMGAKCNLVLPDLHVTDPRRTSPLPPFYVEVKTKADFSFTHSTESWDTGIGIRKWERLKHFWAVTRTPTFLLFFHDMPGELFGCRVGTCEPYRKYDGDRMDGGGMAFWRKDQLRKIAQLERRQNVLPLPDDGASP